MPAPHIATATTKATAKSTTTSKEHTTTEPAAVTKTNKATQKTTEKLVATATTLVTAKQKKQTAHRQIASNTKIETATTTAPVATVVKTAVTNNTKKKGKKATTTTAQEYAAATKNTANDPTPTTEAQEASNTNTNTTAPTASARNKQKNPSKKQPLKTTQPVASAKGAAPKPVPAASQPVAAGKPTAKKMLTLGEKGEEEGVSEPETAEAVTEPVVAAAPPQTAKPEEKKPAAKPVEVKKAEEPIAEKAATTDSTKEDEPEAVRRFMAGIKGGYEGGSNSQAAKKAVIAPYFQYNIGGKFSLMLQPSLKTSFLKKRYIGNASSYYNVHPGTGSYTILDSSLTPVIDPITGAIVDEYWTRNYAYTEKHDSMVKTYSIGGRYMEVELPLLLNYSITSKLSVYGGVNTVYSKLISVKENTYEAKGVEATGHPSTLALKSAPAPNPTETGITYAGNPYASYTGPQYTAQKGSNFRMGYMLGFSYEIKKRWMADVLLQQTFITPNPQAGYNINTPLSMPYVRFTLGYRLTK